MPNAEPYISRGATAASMPLFENPLSAETAPQGKLPIAVIGAGFSGTIAALHLLRRLPADQPVLLCERAPDFARGLAYSTGDSDHLLNVRAANMSALADDPLHFDTWLRCRPATPDGVQQTEAGTFASRGLYGSYLRSILDGALRETACRAQLRLLPDNATDILPRECGGFDLVCSSGNRLPIAGAVLAVGNLPPEENPDPRICANPWGEKAWRPIEGNLPVLVIGTGLTMIDLVMSARRRGFAGPLIALSRGGLLPTRHAPTGQWPTPLLTDTETTSLPALTARIRREIEAAAEAGIDWRAVIDSLRPITATVWAKLPLSERRRFLRHARRYWDIHRHRMAPPHADAIEAMQQNGTLQILAGRIRAITAAEDGVHVRYQPKNGGDEQTLIVQRVIMANGLEQIGRTRDPLMQRLIDRGLIRVDAQGLGLDVTEDLKIVGRNGTPSDRIWALGPIVRGVFWECIAVPDIRVQASQVAESVAAQLRADAPRWSFAI